MATVYHGVPAAYDWGTPNRDLLQKYWEQISTRQNRMENPDRLSQIINKFTGGGQRPVSEMIPGLDTSLVGGSVLDATGTTGDMGAKFYRPDLEFSGSQLMPEGPEYRNALSKIIDIYRQEGVAAKDMDLSRENISKLAEAGGLWEGANYAKYLPAPLQKDERMSAMFPSISGILSAALPSPYHDKFTLPQQAYTQLNMGYSGPTVFGQHGTNLSNYDIFGRNVRHGGERSYDQTQQRDIDKLDKLWGVGDQEVSKSFKGKDYYSEGLSLEYDEDSDSYMFKENGVLTSNAQKANKMNQMNLFRYNYDKKGVREMGNIQKAFDINKEQRKAYEELTRQEQDAADIRFQDTRDYDEYAGVGGVPIHKIEAPVYTYEGSDEQDKANEGSSFGGSNIGDTKHGSSGMTKDEHAAFRMAGGGRVGLKDGGTWSPGVGRTAEGYIDRPTEIETDTTETVDIEPSLVFGQDTDFDIKDFKDKGFGVPFDLNPTTLARIQGNIYPTEEDLINIEGSLGVGNDKYNLTTDFTDEGVIGTNVNLNNFYANIDPYKNVSDLGYANNIGDWNYDINYRPENKNLMLQIGKSFKNGGRVYLNLGGLASLL